MNYEELLKKYMRMILQYEGRSYVSNVDDDFHRVDFTEEEKAALRKMVKELNW